MIWCLGSDMGRGRGGKRYWKGWRWNLTISVVGRMHPIHLQEQSFLSRLLRPLGCLSISYLANDCPSQRETACLLPMGQPTSNDWSVWTVKVAQSCPTLCGPWNFPGQNTWAGSFSLLQRIFPTEGLNPGLPHHKQIFYWLSHQGSPGILAWVAYPFLSGSSQPRNGPRVSCIAGRFFTSWAIRKAQFGEKQ